MLPAEPAVAAPPSAGYSAAPFHPMPFRRLLHSSACAGESEIGVGIARFKKLDRNLDQGRCAVKAGVQ